MDWFGLFCSEEGELWQAGASIENREAALEINRAVVVVKPRQPYVDWANSFDDGTVKATLDSLHEDPTVYLVPPYDMDDEREEILKVCFSVIFENELEGWVTDEALWPKRRDYATFTQWFDVEFHSMIVDLWDQPLEHEDA